jgi:hypothetical protein
LAEWFKWYSTYLASTRVGVQTPVPPKNKQKNCFCLLNIVFIWSSFTTFSFVQPLSPSSFQCVETKEHSFSEVCLFLLIHSYSHLKEMRWSWIFRGSYYKTCQTINNNYTLLVKKIKSCHTSWQSQKGKNQYMLLKITDPIFNSSSQLTEPGSLQPPSISWTLYVSHIQWAT